MPRHRGGFIAAAGSALLAVAACGLPPALLGDREPCWGGEPRVGSLVRGTLEIGPPGPYLATLEGGELPLLTGTISGEWSGTTVRLVDPANVTVAATGDLVTLFGGVGADGMVVCAVESRER